MAKQKNTQHRQYLAQHVLYTADCTDLNEFLIQGTTYLALFNVVDYGSKYAWSFLLRDKKAQTIIEKLAQIFKLPIEVP